MKLFPHGIDIAAPGGIAALIDFHRKTFGDAVMEAGATPPAPPAADAPKPAVPEAKADEPLEAPGLKALQAEREARAEAERKLAVFEAAQADAEKAKLSDIERATNEAAEARKEAEAARAEALRLRIAAKHGISDEEDMELFLTGTDEATLTRQAEKLAARDTTPNSPKPDLSQGARGQGAPLSTEPGAATFAAGVRI